MINHVYQLIRPKFITVKYDKQQINDANTVIVKPNYMALCHADQRYYQGKREEHILQKKLPMALIHECCGIVVFDPTGTYKAGQKVVLIPNQPPYPSDEEFYENYMAGTKFLSSGYDGFMRETVALPVDRVVPYHHDDDKVAAISEFISVGVHAMHRLLRISHRHKERIAILGDGSLAYVMANIVNYFLPEAQIIVIGRNREKLDLFNFVTERYIVGAIPEDLQFNHAFECCGGDGSGIAINDIIQHINAQGAVILMGVSENKVSINTRDILEKGLTLVGSSRSGREDFEGAVKMLEEKVIQQRLRKIIQEVNKVQSIQDIHRVFSEDLSTPFKTVFKWEM